jgi:hypothetical protein
MRPSEEGRNDRDVAAQLAWVAEVLNTSGLSYWADSGTLLGLVRDGRIPPSDPDIDLGVWSEDEPALREALRAFTDAGYRIRTERYRSLPFNLTCVPPLRSGLKRIDVYVYREADGHAWAPAILPRHTVDGRGGGPGGTPWRLVGAPWRFLLRGLWARVVREMAVDAWPWRGFFAMRTWWIPREHLEETTTLEGVPFPVPARWDDYLEFRYGSWKVPARKWSFWTDDGAIRAERPEVVLTPQSNGG